MKRLNNLFERIYDIDNLKLADERARKGKGDSYGVKIHDRNREGNILALHRMLKEGTYRTSPYKVFTIREPKERQIYQLPYFPDRICHHAIMNIMEPVWVSLFSRDTYSCIKGRGIHGALDRIKEDIKDVEGTQYCLKLDVKKFYPSIDHGVLKQILRKKVKDACLLKLLDEIVDTAPGVPIGNYLSQYFANLYLAYFDHWIKEVQCVRYYYRYADDIVVLSGSKGHLHELFQKIKAYLNDKLKLDIKGNYQVFPVSARGIDFLGYRIYHTHILLRKSIKKSFARKAASGAGMGTIASYYGWASHCNSKNLLKKLGYEIKQDR